MPITIKHNFERQYGKRKGDRIFYSWENKHGMLERRKHESIAHEARENARRTALMIACNKKKRRMLY
jgi:hypothetical protein